MPPDAPDGPPAFYDDLDLTLDEAWHRIARGAADRRSAFHTPTLATVGEEGVPHLRTVVLRGAEPSAWRLRVHTDWRSRKIPEIQADPRVGLHFYDPRAKIQVRLTALASIHTDDAVADAAWQGTTEMGRRCYLEEPAPGTPLDAPSSGLTKAQETAVPRGEASEAGRSNFAVLMLEVRSVEWLFLAARGHRRARFARGDEGDVQSVWLVP